MAATRRPRILVPADLREIGGYPFHAAGDKYLVALHDAAGAMPLVVPAFGSALDLADLLAEADGLLLTGSISNVEPQHYGGGEADCPPYDPDRDATTLPLIPQVIAAGVPLLAICRGFQELNVALGGTLSPRVHEIPGRIDHRAPEGKSKPEQYAPAHPVTLTAAGAFLNFSGGEQRIMVNSLHWQGVDRLSPRLTVEARADDGTIEGVRVTDAPEFALGVQWHPEWRALENPFSTALFKAFGDAARARAERRRAA